MRTDILEEFCKGKKPKELIDKNMATPKTIYYYHKIYKDIKSALETEEFKNQMILLLLKLRIKER